MLRPQSILDHVVNKRKGVLDSAARQMAFSQDSVASERTESIPEPEEAIPNPSGGYSSLKRF